MSLSIFPSSFILRSLFSISATHSVPSPSMSIEIKMSRAALTCSSASNEAMVVNEARLSLFCFRKVRRSSSRLKRNGGSSGSGRCFWKNTSCSARSAGGRCTGLPSSLLVNSTASCDASHHLLENAMRPDLISSSDAKGTVPLIKLYMMMPQAQTSQLLVYFRFRTSGDMWVNVPTLSVITARGLKVQDRPKSETFSSVLVRTSGVEIKMFSALRSRWQMKFLWR
mmetsp:Transcript_94281/g.224486  ORF Transcript_94281/g.224486 Transcript_94281/m.224486 type:complete len:225 (+) Transcript_94281:480-1154(+)